MGAHFSSKHYRRKLTMIPNISLDTTFPMPSVTMLPPWLFLLPITLPGLSNTNALKSPPNIVSNHPSLSMCLPQSPNATSKRRLNAKRLLKNSPRSPVNPSRPPLPSLLPMPTGDMDMDSPSHTTSPLLLPQLPSQKNKASLQLMIM